MANREQVQNLLERAEQIDGYRAACGACFSNAAARRYYNYAGSSVKDSERLSRLVEDIRLLDGTVVIIMDSTAENGYPHTRPPNIVCLPSSYVTTKGDAELSTTLRHEAIHIHQRANEAVWLKACRREGWEPIQPEKIPVRYRKRCRLNPDTIHPHQFWAWRAQYVPLPLFSTEMPASISDVVVKWYDLTDKQLISQTPKSFEARYGSGASQPEHPYELLAVEMAEAGVSTPQALIANLFKQ